MDKTYYANLIKKIMNSTKESLELAEEDQEINNLEKSSEEEKDTDKSKKLEEEAEKLCYEKYLLPIYSDISNQDMINILNLLTPDFIEENHIKTSWFRSDFELLLEYIIKNIDDPNYTFRNSLLRNQDFIDAISYNSLNLATLLSNSNDENSILKFLNEYSLNFDKVGKSDASFSNNLDFGDIYEELITSPNLTQEFKNKLLEDEKRLYYVNAFTLRKIIVENKISKERSRKILFDDIIFDKFSEYDIGVLIAYLYNTKEEYKEVIFQDKIINNISFTDFFINSKLNYNDMIELLFDERIINKLESYQISRIISNYDLNYDEIKSIIFDERVFNKLSGFDIAPIISSPNLNSTQRKELLFDEKIYNKFVESYTPGTDFSRLFFEDDFSNKLRIPVEDALDLFKDQKIFKYLPSDIIQKIIISPSLSLGESNELLFDDNIFYKAIGEYNEVYNNEPYLDRGPFRYDKKDYLQKLYNNNPFISKTICLRLFKDEILDNGFDFIEKMSKYPYVAESLASLYDRFAKSDRTYFENMLKSIENTIYIDDIDISTYIIKLIDICHDNSYYGSDILKVKQFSKIRHTANLKIDELTKEQWQILTQIALRDMSSYYNEVSTGLFGQQKEDINLTLNLIPDITENNDLDTYEERRIQLCDKEFKEALLEKNLNRAKNAYLNKYLNINIEEAQAIFKMYGSDISSFNDSSNPLNLNYIGLINSILEIKDLKTLVNTYIDELPVLSFDEIIYIDQSIKQMFSKNISDNVFKINNDLDNPLSYVEYGYVNDGKTTIKKIPLYDVGFDFKMLVHSTAAYGQMNLINDNYFDSWNNSERKSNHGICCCLISNDNLGLPAINDVLFGFDEWDPKAISKSAPYDIYSQNDDYEIKEGRQLKFMSAQAIIDNTRHTHNEQVLERNELRIDKINQGFNNIPPSYVVMLSDMSDELKQKAVKCASQMNIPIVYLDKQKVIENEVIKIDKKIEMLEFTDNYIEKIELLKNILLSHENNRSGLRASTPELMDKYFPSEKIKNLFSKVISDLQNKLKFDDNLEEYYVLSTKIINLLNSEEKKFNVAMETTERKNYIDIPVDEYKSNLMQFIDENLCKTSIPKLDRISSILFNTEDDTSLATVLRKSDLNEVKEVLDDLISKNMYEFEGKNHNICHIEKVILFSQIIAKQELLLEDGTLDKHSYDLLIECAKFHDCGRQNDNVDKRHAIKSAEKMVMLLKEKYDDIDLRIMAVAVEYHEELDNDNKFERICSKYSLSGESKQIAKKIAVCLKDADALDRTRFKNLDAKLKQDMLRTETAKKIVPIAKDLNNKYNEIDYHMYYDLVLKLLNNSYELKESGGVKL